MNRSIQKNWDLDRFLEDARQIGDIGQQVKDVIEDFKISKEEHQSIDFSKEKQVGRTNRLEETTAMPRKQKTINTQKYGKEGAKTGYLWLPWEDKNIL